MRIIHTPSRRRLAKSMLSAAAGILLFAAVLPLSSLAQEDEFAGERIVHLLQEPRHRTVHHDGDLYLLDVQVNPGDVSLPHIHDQAILLTYINMSDGPRNGDVNSNTDYASQPHTHKVSNAGPGLFRIIALVNAGAGNADLMADRPSGFSGEPQHENAWFRSYRVELAPSEETSVQIHSLASFVVQVADGLFHVERSDGITAELDARADWVWHDPNEAYVIRNVGQVASAVVINEGRY